MPPCCLPCAAEALRPCYPPDHGKPPLATSPPPLPSTALHRRRMVRDRRHPRQPRPARRPHLHPRRALAHLQVSSLTPTATTPHTRDPSAHARRQPTTLARSLYARRSLAAACYNPSANQSHFIARHGPMKRAPSQVRANLLSAIRRKLAQSCPCWPALGCPLNRPAPGDWIGRLSFKNTPGDRSDSHPVGSELAPVDLGSLAPVGSWPDGLRCPYSARNCPGVGGGAQASTLFAPVVVFRILIRRRGWCREGERGRRVGSLGEQKKFVGARGFSVKAQSMIRRRVST